MNAGSCSICNTPGHAATKCPALRDPLKEGFYSGGGGGGGHSHDDDDERIRLQNLYKKLKQMLVQNICPV